MVLIMTDRFRIEKLDNYTQCSDHYCTGHDAWHIVDTKTNKTLIRYRAPTQDRIEEMNWLVECIEETSF